MLTVGGSRSAIVLRSVGDGDPYHGYPFEVQRRTSGRWVHIPTSTRFNFVELGLKPRASFRQAWAVPQDLASGRYRIVKKVNRFTLRAQFPVRRPAV